MTRIEKWQEYRNEIAMQSQISADIKLANSDLEDYKTEINKINPAILSSTSNERIILQPDITSTDVENKQIATQVVEAFKMLNLPANILNQNKVETIFYNCKNLTIIENDEKNTSSFKQKYFEMDNNYKIFVKKVGLNANNRSDDSITNELQTDFNNFKSNVEGEELKHILTMNKAQPGSKASHYLFVISVAVSAFMLLVVLALFIARLVTR